MLAPAARNAARKGNGNNRNAFAVFDISDPYNPERVFWRQDGETNEFREQHGHVIYHKDGQDVFVTVGVNGLLVWDVTDPTNPILLSNFSPSIAVVRILTEALDGGSLGMALLLLGRAEKGSRHHRPDGSDESSGREAGEPQSV